jgi:hypothetical protein
VWRVFVYLASLSNVHIYRGARYIAAGISGEETSSEGKQLGLRLRLRRPVSNIPKIRVIHARSAVIILNSRRLCCLSPAPLSTRCLCYVRRGACSCAGRHSRQRLFHLVARCTTHNTAHCRRVFSSGKARGGVSCCEEAQECASVRPKKYAPPRARPDSPTAGAPAASSRSARGRAGPNARDLVRQDQLLFKCCGGGWFIERKSPLLCSTYSTQSCVCLLLQVPIL